MVKWGTTTGFIHEVHPYAAGWGGRLPEGADMSWIGGGEYAERVSGSPGDPVSPLRLHTEEHPGCV